MSASAEVYIMPTMFLIGLVWLIRKVIRSY